MKLFRILALGTLLFILALSACSSEAPVEVSRPEPKADISEPPNTPFPSVPQISVLEPTPADNNTVIPRVFAEKAIADLARYLSIDADQIRVVESKAVDWPDASLGCPKPETAYAQVITPGYWLVLEAQGQLYPYHTDQEDQVILCLGKAIDSGSGTPLPVIPINPDEIMDGQPWVPVN